MFVHSSQEADVECRLICRIVANSDDNFHFQETNARASGQ